MGKTFVFNYNTRWKDARKFMTQQGYEIVPQGSGIYLISHPEIPDDVFRLKASDPNSTPGLLVRWYRHSQRALQAAREAAQQKKMKEKSEMVTSTETDMQSLGAVIVNAAKAGQNIDGVATSAETLDALVIWLDQQLEQGVTLFTMSQMQHVTTEALGKDVTKAAIKTVIDQLCKEKILVQTSRPTEFSISADIVLHRRTTGMADIIAALRLGALKRGDLVTQVTTEDSVTEVQESVEPPVDSLTVLTAKIVGEEAVDLLIERLVATNAYEKLAKLVRDAGSNEQSIEVMKKIISRTRQAVIIEENGG